MNQKKCIFAALNFSYTNTEEMEETISTNPIEEARRYVANAEEIIKRSTYDPETKLYKDKKFVRIAGDTLWKGCLIALKGYHYSLSFKPPGPGKAFQAVCL